MAEYILGIDMNDISTSACLVRDGELVAAAQEERFNREKRTRRFPVKAMDWCLKSNCIELEDVAAVAVSVNPAVYLENLNVAHSGRARFRGELLYAAPNFLLGIYDGLAARTSILKIETDGGKQLDVYYIRHHDAHAAAAFFMSAFEESAVFTADAFGEKDTAVFFKASGAGIERLRSFEFPYSLGCFYAAVTEFLGFRPFADEWKVMGAAAYGDSAKFSGAFSSLIDFEPETGLRMDLDSFNHYQFHRPKLYSGKLTAPLGSPYGDKKEFDARFFDIAAAAQNAVERVVFKMLRYLHEVTGTKNLCLSGGVAMNCVMNGKIHEQIPFERIYIPPAPDDSGTSAGAALMVSRILNPRLETAPVIRCDFGPAFSDSEIEAALKTAGLKYEKTSGPARDAAEAISRNRIAAWFQGEMEFGERALGNRSILADPRDPRMKDRLNSEVKFRESFQPFAPSVLSDFQDEWFCCGAPVFFMEKAFRIKEQKRNLIPAVVHKDGTARLQTVSEKSNPLFHELISAFHKLTGVPLVLNTSFNLRDEPIVMTPLDAIRTFFSCGIDDLFIGSFHLSK